jgi:hypothetical protein
VPGAAVSSDLGPRATAGEARRFRRNPLVIAPQRRERTLGCGGGATEVDALKRTEQRGSNYCAAVICVQDPTSPAFSGV